METDMKKPSRKLRVGYILKMFPRFSETFIMNEILELERQGVEVTILSILPPTEGRFHPRVSDIRAEVRYLPPHRYSEFWNSLRNSNGYLRAHKKGYASALWHALECSKESALKYLIRAGTIAEWNRGLNLDHFHSHFASSPTHVAMYASMMTGVPYSFIAHAKDIFLNDMDKKLFRQMVKNSSFAVTVSNSNRLYLRKMISNNEKNKIIRVYNGLDLKYFKNQGSERASNHILSVGRLVEKKGFHILIEAMRILKERNRNFVCEIIGEGDQRLSLENLISQYNLKRAVRLLGALPQDEVIQRMKRSTIFVLPSIIARDGNRDALPTVLLEALAIGIPAISTDVVGIPEILEKGKCGKIIKQDDPLVLADSIETLIDSPSIRNQFVRAGFHKAKKDFNIRVNAKELLRHMERSVKRSEKVSRLGRAR
jgi:glycosyltransferase involved in cell wall biosynthesis